jgi:hypothetical protein
MYFTTTTGSTVLKTYRGWAGSLATFSALFCAIAGVAMGYGVYTKGHIKPPPDVEWPTGIPTSFGVDDAYLLPPSDQKNIGTCWAFATVYLLESQYRAQGIERGLLKKDEYVPFSKQAFLRWLHNRCKGNPNVKACHYGGILRDDPADHEIEALYYFFKAFPDAKTSLLPEAVCAYPPAPPTPIPANYDWFVCDGADDAYAKTPINYTIKNISMAYSVNGIKELLVKSKRALGIGIPLPSLVYYVPCAGSPFETADADCVNRVYPCPEYTGVDGFCHRAEFDGADENGVFLATIDPKYMGESGGHAMNVVGYNDGWVYRSRFQSQETHAQLRGGFVLHNSWRAGGHSPDYLLGRQSEENEAVICPNHIAPENWVPARFQDVVYAAGNNTIRNFLNVSQDIKRVRGAGRTNGSDLLYCHHDDCDRNLLYVLERVGSDANVKFTASGLSEISFITIDNRTTPYNVSRTVIKSLPFWALDQYFRPITATFVPNNPTVCGYWMLPYQTLENMQRIGWDLLDNFRVVDLELEFANQSYDAHKDSGRFDKTLLKRSTKTLVKPSFDGPLPFDKIYN